MKKIKIYKFEKFFRSYIFKVVTAEKCNYNKNVRNTKYKSFLKTSDRYKGMSERREKEKNQII